MAPSVFAKRINKWEQSLILTDSFTGTLLIDLLNHQSQVQHFDEEYRDCAPECRNVRHPTPPREIMTRRCSVRDDAERGAFVPARDHGSRNCCNLNLWKLRVYNDRQCLIATGIYDVRDRFD